MKTFYKNQKQYKMYVRFVAACRRTT